MEGWLGGTRGKEHYATCKSILIRQTGEMRKNTGKAMEETWKQRRWEIYENKAIIAIFNLISLRNFIIN